MKNILLSISENYSFKEIKPFVKSFREHNTEDDIVIFFSHTSRKTINKSKEYGVIPILYNNDKSLYESINIPNGLSPNSSRYFYYLGFLTKNKIYNNIILSDIRDVYFQRNPFDSPIENGLTCFLEDGKEKIGTNKYTNIWIKHAYGDMELGKIGDNLISCSGFTVGDYGNILEYLSKMTNELKGHKNIGGLDQGIHNYLIYNDLLSKIHLVEDNSRNVITLSYFREDTKIHFNKQGEIINKDGTPLDVIHQYDRNWKLLWKYNKPYYFQKRWNLIKRFFYPIYKLVLLKK